MDQAAITVDPRYSFWLSVALGCAGFLTASGALLIDTGTDPITIKHFLAWLSLLAGMGNIVNAALAAIPGKNPTGGNFYANKVFPPTKQ